MEASEISGGAMKIDRQKKTSMIEDISGVYGTSDWKSEDQVPGGWVRVGDQGEICESIGSMRPG